MAIRAVLFDMDGVLVDSETYYCEGTFRWMKELGFQGEQKEIYCMLGTTMEVTYQMMQKLLGYTHSLDKIQEVNETYFKEHPIPYKEIMIPGVKELLLFLKEKGIKTAVCSSSPLDLIEKCTEECDIRKYFDYIVSGEQFKNSKPDPEIYLHAAEVFGYQPEECLVIEDAKLGIEAGVNAGMKVIALHNPKFMQDQSKASWQSETMSGIQTIISQEISGNKN